MMTSLANQRLRYLKRQEDRELSTDSTLLLSILNKLRQGDRLEEYTRTTLLERIDCSISMQSDETAAQGATISCLANGWSSSTDTPL